MAGAQPRIRFSKVMEIRSSAPSANLAIKPGQMAWAHFMALGEDQTIYVADVLNWRFQVFGRIPSTGKMTTYIPSVRMFWGSVPSVDWSSKQADIPFK
jgi:hypothetical protein